MYLKEGNSMYGYVGYVTMKVRNLLFGWLAGLLFDQKDMVRYPPQVDDSFF